MLAAALLDLAVGDPLWLPHPVVVMGDAIAAVERRVLLPRRSPARERFAGAVLTVALVGLSAAFAKCVARSPVLSTILAASTLALRSLDEATRAVLACLDRRDLPAARAAVAAVVGRDVDALEAGDVAAAAIEALAESLCDGVASPLVWLAIMGAPGGLAFKAISTLDSMIGHREDPHTWFGAFAARSDDVANWIPARLTAMLICVCAPAVGGSTSRAIRTMRRDARKHRSPNAGWPQAAMAGALDVRLGGPVRYDGTLCARAVLGSGPVPGRDDLRRALHLSRIVAATAAALAASGRDIVRRTRR